MYLFGYLSLLLLIVFAVWTIFKHFRRKSVYISFYNLACLQFLFFILFVVHYGIVYAYICWQDPMEGVLRLFPLTLGHHILELGTEIVIVGILVPFVSLFTGTKPNLNAGILASVWFVLADLVILIGCLVALMSPVPVLRF